MSTTQNRYAFLKVRVPKEVVAEFSQSLFALGAIGVETRDDETLISSEIKDETFLIAHFPDESVAQLVQETLSPEWDIALDFVVGDGWRTEWKKFFHPQKFGERLVICPSWESFDAKATDVVVTLDPGNAFGSGLHETTRLVLAYLERSIQGGESVLDVGCGSGILAIAALRLGAARADAVDIDEAAVRVCLENAEINCVTIDASTQPVEALSGTYDIVLANIRTEVLVEKVEALAARIRPGGRMILSGILETEKDQVLDAFSRLENISIDQQGEWIACLMKG